MTGALAGAAEAAAGGQGSPPSWATLQLYPLTPQCLVYTDSTAVQALTRCWLSGRRGGRPMAAAPGSLSPLRAGGPERHSSKAPVYVLFLLVWLLVRHHFKHALLLLFKHALLLLLPTYSGHHWGNSGLRVQSNTTDGRTPGHMDDDDDYGTDAGGTGGDDDLVNGLMQRIAAISTVDPIEQQRQFAEILGLPLEQAAFFLSAAGGNLEAAFNLCLDFSRTGQDAAVRRAPSAFYMEAAQSSNYVDDFLDSEGALLGMDDWSTAAPADAGFGRAGAPQAGGMPIGADGSAFTGSGANLSVVGVGLGAPPASVPAAHAAGVPAALPGFPAAAAAAGPLQPPPPSAGGKMDDDS
jgi:hypothetical protein